VAICSYSPLREVQMTQVPSKLVVASRSPPGDQHSARIVLSCASSRIASQIHFPPRSSQILTVLSPPHDARVLPEGDHATHHT